ncbi:MAG: hypothetical protein HQ534_11945 [Armatimonadetes bacterium]|nr:hypothetical protein [Armatimonadota bacterium]
MKNWIILYLLFAAIVLYAENRNETVCIQFHQALDSLNHTKNEIVPTSFEFENKTYEGSYWYKAGWRADIRFCADGPGSTFYLIRNGKFFCTVRWYFVSYIDDNGEFIAGDELSGRIQCAVETIENEE